MKKLTLLLKEEPITPMRPCSSFRFPRLLGTSQSKRGQNIIFGLNEETHLRPTLRGYGGTRSPSQYITLTVVTYGKPLCSFTGHVALNYHLNIYKSNEISKTCPRCLEAEEISNNFIGVSEMVGSEECSLQLILSEHIRSGRRLLHFCYHEVHQRDRASKHHHRIARLVSGQAGLLIHYHLDHAIKLHGVGKGRPRSILNVVLRT